MMRLLAVLIATALAMPAQAQWVRDEGSLAWMQDGRMAWRFSFDPKFGKPFFHPLAVGAGPSFTNFKPEDHPWHYAHWFSWKYINHVNYWEEDRTSGQAVGRTKWETPRIDTRGDGGATIRMRLSYQRPSGEVDLTEQRTIEVSPVQPDGGFTIDWTMEFTAGPEGAVLDRTPMPGEPNGAFNGGYAGLSMRLAAAPIMMSVMTTNGPVTTYARDRARPNAAAVAANFTEGDKDLGGVAILSAPGNAGREAPWYIINVPTDFRFVNAAVLSPSVRTIAAGGELSLRYRVVLRGNAWGQEDLKKALAGWR